MRSISLWCQGWGYFLFGSTVSLIYSYRRISNKIRKSHSVWVIISSKDSEKIQIVVNQAALSYATPSFDVHMTLGSGFHSVEDAKIFIIEHSIPKILLIDPKPFAVIDNNSWSTVVVLKVLNINVENLTFPVCGPHISLQYDDYTGVNINRRRESVASELSKILVDIPSELQVSEVQIWDTSSNYDTSKWKKIWSGIPRFYL